MLIVAMNKYILIIAVILILALGVAFFLNTKETEAGSLDSFAKCLSEKGSVMYGTYWCSHCLDQKNMFGKSFQYINYVECSEEIERCNEDKIEATPTWIFGDGTRNVGKMSMEEISKVTGCVLPAK